MTIERRHFLQLAGAALTGCVASSASASVPQPAPPMRDGVGMLVDTTECIGCRKCEWACNQENRLSRNPIETFETKSVFETERRMTTEAYTIVNRYPNPHNAEHPYYAKMQCMHCLQPACVSACLVGALTRDARGAVVYDADKCMGCRYCMVACPFQVPAYEYAKPLTPRVQKCTFCFDRIAQEGRIPACAEMCPPMSLTFGKRSELLTLAHDKIRNNPTRYVDHVYGELEAGGTAWLYLAGKPFVEMGFLPLGPSAVPSLTEAIQHSIFRYGAAPLMLFGLLGIAMHVTREQTDRVDGAIPVLAPEEGGTA